MKETVRTASVLEIYNEAIKNLTEEKRSLQIELKTLQGGDVVKQVATQGSRVILIVAGVMIQIISVIIGIFMFAFAYDTGNGGGIILFLISVGFFFLGFTLFRKGIAIKDPEKLNKERISEIKNRLIEIDSEINDRKLRKKSLLEAEEVIASKDIKTEKSTGSAEEKVKPFDTSNQSDEKDCPMCAETVKAAAKICRFCNHKFPI